MLQKINSGDMNGAQQILGNFMNEQGIKYTGNYKNKLQK